MLATLGEARQDALSDIAGSCNNTPEFRQLLNTATRRLMRRGDFVGTVVPIQVCTYGGCVVFPRYVGWVRKINVCRNRIPVQNQWYSFLLYENDWRSCWDSCAGDPCTVIGQDRSPVFQDVQGEGRLIRAYIRYNADLDKTLTIFGIDNNGQTLMHQNTDGTWDEGRILTFTKPFASTQVYVRRIDRILKDETEGPVDVYAYDVANDLLEDVAHYEPSETNPSLARYKLSACSPACLKSVVALVKLQYVPAKVDTDLVLIQNLDALKDYMQSLKFREAGDTASANEYEISAIRELNLELWNRDQENGVPVSLGELDGTDIGRQRCF